MKISPMSAAIYSFSSGLKTEQTDTMPFGKLIHETSFFRNDEKPTDIFMQKYARENFSKEDEINVVSLGSSDGREAYSWAMIFDEYKGLRVVGLDLSQACIDCAKQGRYKIDSRYENYLRDPRYLDWYGSDYERECLKKFHKYFNPTENWTEFQLKEGALANCSFIQGDVSRADEFIAPKSADIALFRNTLYHLICKEDFAGQTRNLTQDFKDVTLSVVEAIKRTLKSNGLLIFGSREKDTGVDLWELYNTMKSCGFEAVYTSPPSQEKIDMAYEMKRKYNDDSYLENALYSNIWRKV